MTTPPESRRRRLALNSLFSLISWFLPIIIGLIATPVLVNGLGNETYGIYAVIVGFISYSFTFGLGKIVAKYVAEYRAANDIEKINEVISATFWLSLAIGTAGAGILALSAQYIVSDILLIDGVNERTAVIALYIASATSLMAMISQIFQYVMHGLQKFGRYLLLNNLNGLLLGVGNIVLVYHGYGIDAILLWNLALTCLLAILFYIQAKSIFPRLRIGLGFRSDMLRTVAGYGGIIILYQLFANVLYLFERAWITRKFGAEAMAFYAVPLLLAAYLHSLVGSFAMVLFPVINELLTDPEKQVELYMKSTKLILAVIVFIVTTFICTGRIGLSLWINAEFAGNSYSLLVIHSITFGMIALMVIAWQLNEGFRAASLNALITALWAAIAIPLMIAVADQWKTEGIATARLAAVCASLPMVFYVEKRFLGRTFWRFWFAILIRIAAAAFFLALFQSLVIGQIESGRLALVVAGIGGFAVFAVVLFLSGYFTRADREAVLQMLSVKRKLA